MSSSIHGIPVDLTYSTLVIGRPSNANDNNQREAARERRLVSVQSPRGSGNLTKSNRVQLGTVAPRGVSGGTRIANLVRGI